MTREEQRDKRGLSAQDRYTKDHEQAYRPDARELFYRPTETQLLRDADTFLHFRIRAVMRNAIRSWRNNALKAIKEHEGMASIAQAHDFETLLRQSFEQWRANLHQKVEAAATERYFAQLEQRAEKARDLHLLSKAFTHWQQIAREKVEYADEARRQVLRVKYFHAWLTLTVENNRKVQLHGERKFYNVWSERYLISLRNNEKASFTRARNLVKSDYWKWFWTFCERRAPQWRNRRLQSTIFNRWVLLGRENAYREYEVAVREQHIVKKKWFSKWLQHARAALSNSRAAEKIYQQKVAARSMLECRRQVRYAPLARQVSNMADWRIAGSTFAIFVNRYRTEQQAYKVNQLRIQRNAWTAWNDRLRWQTLESQIDDRVLVQALYRWVLAERAILLQRLCEQRLRRECLQKLIDHYRIRAIAQEAACGNMKRKRQARVLRLIIFRWRHALDVCRQNDQVAFDFEAPRVIQQTLSALSSKLDHARQLDKWAADGHYYFCTTRYLRQWRTTTAESRRRKLHEAYAHIRRQTKMKLANSCIRIWRDRTQHVGNMQEQAHLYSQTQILRFGTALFDHWRDRLAFILDREDQTTLEFDRRFAHKHLDTWASKYRTLTQLHELARVNVELRISNKWLHTLHLRIIELKGRESNAERIRRWYEKRHSHNILRRWREKTAKRRDQPLQPAVFSSARAVRRLAIRPQDAAAGQDNAVRADEEWTAFDEGGFDVGEWIPGLENVEASSTPLPGYLSTPSKRAARARGLVRMSTTPMGTPFAARLRSQLGKTPSKFGRSNVGIGGSAFGPIPESEPRTPDAS